MPDENPLTLDDLLPSTEEVRRAAYLLYEQGEAGALVQAYRNGMQCVLAPIRRAYFDTMIHIADEFIRALNIDATTVLFRANSDPECLPKLYWCDREGSLDVFISVPLQTIRSAAFNWREILDQLKALRLPSLEKQGIVAEPCIQVNLDTGKEELRVIFSPGREQVVR